MDNKEFNYMLGEYKRQGVLNKAIKIINDALEQGENIRLYVEDSDKKICLSKGDELKIISYHFRELK